MININFLDMFAGIGGFRLGLERNGFNPIGWVEFDKFARASYEAMYDVEDEWTAWDATKITEEDLEPLKGKVDVITGGFPCQAFSVAGHRKGFEDTRGTLFFDIARVAKTLKPKALLLENVKGLVNHDKGNTLDTIVKTLNDMGYVVDFKILNSKYFGVPQNRERIFIVAIREDLQKHEEWVIEGTTVVPKGKERIQGCEGTKSFNFDFPKGSSEIPRLKEVLEQEVEERFYLSDERVAQLVPTETNQDTGVQQVMQYDTPNRKNASPYRTYDANGISPTVTTSGGGGREPHVVDGLSIKQATKKGYDVAHEGDSVNYQFPDSKTRRGRVGKQIANTLETSENQGVVEGTGEIERIGYIGRNREQLRVHDTKGIMPTITANAQGGRSPGGLISDYRIRKLTPKECFRLQAYPDELFEKAQEVNSNTQLYKQAGNSVTVNVVEAIAAKLKEL